MLFTLPNKRIGDRTWFYAKADLLYGEVLMYSLAVDAHKCMVWYKIQDTTGQEHVVPEAQVADDDVSLPSPRYKVGDEITYSYSQKGTNEIAYDIGRISNIQVHLDSDGPTIAYLTEEDDEYWIKEEEIEGITEILNRNVDEGAL